MKPEITEEYCDVRRQTDLSIQCPVPDCRAFVLIAFSFEDDRELVEKYKAFLMQEYQAHLGRRH